MNRIDRYIARHFLTGIGIVLMVLLPLFAFLSLSEELENSGKGAFTALDAVAVVGYSLPRIVMDLLPVTALMGVLVGLGTMANHAELIIVRAFGYSALRIAAPVTWTVFGLIAIVAAFQLALVPRFEAQANKLRAKVTLQATASADDSEFWTRSANSFIRIGHVVREGDLSDVEIYKFGDDGGVQQLMQAASVAILDQDRWLLKDVTVADFDGSEVQKSKVARSVWESFLSERETAILLAPVEAMSLPALYRYIQLRKQNDLSTHRYKVIYWQRLSLPIGLLGMALLGLPFLVGSVRSVPVGQRAAIGATIGIFFYLTEQLTSNLALLYRLAPSLTAVAPDLLVLLIAMFILHRKCR